MQSFHSESIDRLFKVIGSLKGQDEFYSFFEDLCTIRELSDMAQRLDTAILLDEGKNYQTIQTQVGVSPATISRVSRCLQYGDGYKKALAALK